MTYITKSVNENYTDCRDCEYRDGQEILITKDVDGEVMKARWKTVCDNCPVMLFALAHYDEME